MHKVASWNVNSIQSRLERVLAFLERERPDVLALQELKCPDEKFPFAILERAGYFASVFGQRTYNGVALLSKEPPQSVRRGFDDGLEDPESRFVSITIKNVHYMSGYIPNGQEVGSPKYEYKLRWFKRLKKYLNSHHEPHNSILLMGDFNVAPTDLDIYDPKSWKDKILFSDLEKEALEEMKSFGFIDTFRDLHPFERGYSWWDYRQMSFQRDLGARIDFIFMTKPLKTSCRFASINRDERRGEKPSDHAPVIAEFLAVA